MDREYSRIMYNAVFDELDHIQANKLYTDEEFQKIALNVAGIGSGIGKGFKALAKDPTSFMKNIKGSYSRGASKITGEGNVMGGIKRVLGTDQGKALAAGTVGAGAVMGTRNDRRY